MKMRNSKQIADDYMAALIAVVGTQHLQGVQLLLETAVREGQQEVIDAVVDGQPELEEAFADVIQQVKS